MDSQRSEFIVRGSTVSEIYSVEFDYRRDILYWADQDSDSVKVGFHLLEMFERLQNLLTRNELPEGFLYSL